MTRVALQLYTIRDDCAHDLEGVLRTVAEIGYDGVELFDLHGHDAVQVRAWLDQFGLVAAKEDDRYAVRMWAPPLTRGQLRRLPAFVTELHDRSFGARGAAR